MVKEKSLKTEYNLQWNINNELLNTPLLITANEPAWSFSDAGMKLVYLIFCDYMALNDKKKQKQQKNLTMSNLRTMKY